MEELSKVNHTRAVLFDPQLSDKRSICAASAHFKHFIHNYLAAFLRSLLGVTARSLRRCSSIVCLKNPSFSSRLLLTGFTLNFLSCRVSPGF